MATITGYNITRDTSVAADTGRKVAVAEGGQIRGRDTFEQTVYTLRVVIHTDADGLSDLDDFYDAYSDIWNNITIDGKGYTWLFTSRPMVIGSDGAVRIVGFDAVGYAT